MKKYKSLIIIFIISLLLEIVVFNFSSWCSIGNEPVDVTEKMSVEGLEDGYVVNISDIDDKLKNIYFDLTMEDNTSVDYSISMTDEGNYYDYYLPAGSITNASKSSFYTNLHSYGKVNTLTITFNYGDNAYKAPFTINRVVLNEKRPICFNLLRCLIVFIILTALFIDNSYFENIRMDYDLLHKGGKRQVMIVALVVVLFVLLGYFLTSSHKLFDEGSKPHHQQYKELAHVLKEGEVALKDMPSEGLLNAPNPYDTIYLQANGIEYKADYAYYNGRYYVYFGIVPEILLYYPYYLITGNDLPNHVATFVFYSIFVLGVFILLRELIYRYFKEVTFVSYILMAASIIISGTFAYIYFTADLYSVPIMAGLGLTLLGLGLWMYAIRTTNPQKLVLYFIGSLLMAMVVGCRPQMILFSALAIPLFWEEVIKKRQLFSKKSIAHTVAICLPYLLVAIGIMYYNYQRFGSVFDFGATYSLTNNDMNLRGISISRMLLGLGSFLFQMPYINGVFPFLQSVDLEYSYMGRMVIEHFFGGIMLTNILCCSVFLIRYYKDELKKRNLLLLTIMLVMISVIIGMLDANTAGVLQRYSADMALGIYLASAIILCIIGIKAPKLGLRILKLGLILEAGYTLLLICNVASGITLKYYNPDLYGKIAAMFRF